MNKVHVYLIFLIISIFVFILFFPWIPLDDNFPIYHPSVQSGTGDLACKPP